MSTAASVKSDHGVKISRACTVRRPAAELYAFWRDLTNLPRVSQHTISVTVSSPRESHWMVAAPFGHDPVEWAAEIINDEPNRLVAWRSLPGSEIPNAGSVRFAPSPDPDETEVSVKIEYDPPGGKLAAFFSKLSHEEPGRQVADLLRRFKALMEAGEIPTTHGQSVGEPQASKKEKDA